MEFKEFLKNGIEKTEINEAAEFKDSTEATDFFFFFDKISSMLNDKRLMAWAKETDDEYDVEMVSTLKDSIKAFDKFYDESLKAE